LTQASGTGGGGEAGLCDVCSAIVDTSTIVAKAWHSRWEHPVNAQKMLELCQALWPLYDQAW